MESKKYEVTVKEKKGSCDNALFEKMAKKGDLTSVKLAELIGVEVKITGYAKCCSYTFCYPTGILSFRIREIPITPS